MGEDCGMGLHCGRGGGRALRHRAYHRPVARTPRLPRAFLDRVSISIGHRISRRRLPGLGGMIQEYSFSSSFFKDSFPALLAIAMV